MKKKKLFLISFLLLLTTVIVLIIYIQTEKKSGILIISHRGASGEEIEHSFKAYDLAIQQVSNYIEQDLVTSKSGTLYVSHDATAKRLTGIDKKYSEMEDFEIDSLVLANGENIHSLQAVFERYKDTINYVIELKEGVSQSETFVNLVRENHLEKRIILQSFHLEALKRVDDIYPDMPKMLLLSEDDRLEELCKEKFIDIMCLNKKNMKEKNIEVVKKYNKLFFVYTLNEVDDIKKVK